ETTTDWYRDWDTIGIKASTNLVASRFIPKHSGVTIKNGIEKTSVTGGNIYFSDPWLSDVNEPPYGLRNQGVLAPHKQRTSPFYPDYTTSYNGDVYKGVFLNQEIAPTNPTIP
ncbi:MAG: peptidase S8, partial [Ignavibacterium sp.]